MPRMSGTLGRPTAGGTSGLRTSWAKEARDHWHHFLLYCPLLNAQSPQRLAKLNMEALGPPKQELRSDMCKRLSGQSHEQRGPSR